MYYVFGREFSMHNEQPPMASFKISTGITKATTRSLCMLVYMIDAS